ncbi:hypothetical protein SAMN03159444_05003 [Pseudomonas sp. NFACC02]|nr:hypothetical protein SAMN03159444_05003 [Pseudomonas sp. NFACC02]
MGCDERRGITAERSIPLSGGWTGCAARRNGEVEGCDTRVCYSGIFLTLFFILKAPHLGSKIYE